MFRRGGGHFPDMINSFSLLFSSPFDVPETNGLAYNSQVCLLIILPTLHLNMMDMITKNLVSQLKCFQNVCNIFIYIDYLRAILATNLVCFALITDI